LRVLKILKLPVWVAHERAVNIWIKSRHTAIGCCKTFYNLISMLPCSIQSQLREVRAHTIFWIYKIFIKLFLAFNNCAKRGVQFFVNNLKIHYRCTRLFPAFAMMIVKHCVNYHQFLSNVRFFFVVYEQKDLWRSVSQLQVAIIGPVIVFEWEN
jgi:hypothetical protein